MKSLRVARASLAVSPKSDRRAGCNSRSYSIGRMTCERGHAASSARQSAPSEAVARMTAIRTAAPGGRYRERTC